MNRVGVAGRYKFEAVRIEDGKEIRRTLLDWVDNLITDNGMDMMGNQPDLIKFCHVGSGNTAPQFTDSGLAVWVAGTETIISDTSAIVAGPPRYGYRRRVYRFGMGVAQGNLSEVGIGPLISGSVFSRALILDSEGNPTTVTVLANEFLDVTFEVRLYIPTGDSIYEVVIQGVPYQVTQRVAENDTSNYWASAIPYSDAGVNSNWWRAHFFTGDLGAEDNSPSGPVHFKDMSRPAYVPGSYERTRIVSLSISEANAFIKSVVIRSAIGEYQFRFVPSIPKDNTKTMSLTFRLQWGRYVP